MRHKDVHDRHEFFMIGDRVRNVWKNLVGNILEFDEWYESEKPTASWQDVVVDVKREDGVKQRWYVHDLDLLDEEGNIIEYYDPFAWRARK